MEKELIYIASPYSDKDISVVLKRYDEVVKYAAFLMNKGDYCFSPVIHCHDVATRHALPTDWAYWNTYCKLMLPRCQKLYVLMLQGWSLSIGIMEEIEIANELKIPVFFINPDNYIIT